MRGLTERTDDVGQLVADLHVAEARGANANLLHHQRDGAALDVGSGDGQGNALALGMRADDDEMSGLAAAGYQGCFDLDFEHFLGKGLFGYNRVHIISCLSFNGWLV